MDILEECSVIEKVKRFPQKGGWFYISVPKQFTENTKEYAERGLVPIIARVENHSWKTSLLPMGDGTQFIGLNAKVRKYFSIEEGDRVEVYFKLRA